MLGGGGVVGEGRSVLVGRDFRVHSDSDLVQIKKRNKIHNSRFFVIPCKLTRKRSCILM